MKSFTLNHNMIKSYNTISKYRTIDLEMDVTESTVNTHRAELIPELLNSFLGFFTYGTLCLPYPHVKL